MSADTQRLREIQERVEKAPLTADELATIRARDGEHRVLRLLATIEDRDRTIAALTREKAESVVTEAMVKAGTQAALAVDVGPGSPDACCSILDYPHPIPATCYLYAHQMEKVVRAALEAALSAGQAESDTKP